MATEQVAQVEAPQARRSWAAHAREWLGNPLVVAVVSAVLVYWIIPQVTRQWQDHAQVLDIQTGLVGEMSRSVSDTVVSGRIIASRLPGASGQADFNRAVRGWAVDSAVVGSKLEAYFPRTTIGEDWRRYSDAVASYLQLSARVNGSRAGHVALIRQKGDLPHMTPPIDWTVLRARSEGEPFQESYGILALALLERRDELVQRVLDAHPSGFG